MLVKLLGALLVAATVSAALDAMPADVVRDVVRMGGRHRPQMVAALRSLNHHYRSIVQSPDVLEAVLSSLQPSPIALARLVLENNVNIKTDVVELFRSIPRSTQQAIWERICSRIEPFSIDADFLARVFIRFDRHDLLSFVAGKVSAKGLVTLAFSNLHPDDDPLFSLDACAIHSCEGLGICQFSELFISSLHFTPFFFA